VLPYLIKDGSIYSTSVYPALGALLGSTFGGNGITTFGVPDERNRMRVPVDTNPGSGFSNRITQAVSGINGTTMGASGGDQSLAAHTHTNTLTDGKHSHALLGNNAPLAAGRLLGGGAIAGDFNTNALGYVSVNSTGTTFVQATTANITVAVNTTGIGVGANVQPSIVSFLALVKT
jgi:microcystin-dependent protein